MTAEQVEVIRMQNRMVRPRVTDNPAWYHAEVAIGGLLRYIDQQAQEIEQVRDVLVRQGQEGGALLSSLRSENQRQAEEIERLQQQWLARSPTHDPELVDDAERIEAELSRDGMHGAAQLIPRLLLALRDSQADSRQQAQLIAQLQSVPEEQTEIAERQAKRMQATSADIFLMFSDLDTLLQDSARWRERFRELASLLAGGLKE